jgi:hypothetical protein
MPSRQFFFDRRRPDDLIFPSCHRCNHATGKSEQVVAALARALREWTPRGLDDERTKDILKRGLSANAPEILREWGTRLSARQRRRFLALREKSGLDLHPINIGPLTRAHVRAFAAKLACALHYKESGGILPASGGIMISMYTLDRLAREGPLKPSFFKILGPVKTLRQGKADVADQFQWASAHDEFGSVHWVNLNGLMELVLMAVCDARMLEPHLRPTERMFHPGHFPADQMDVIDILCVSWTQDFLTYY